MPPLVPVRHVGGFFSGVHYPLRAAIFILRHPSLWPYCVIPLLINTALVIGLVFWLHGYTDTWFEHHLTGTSWYWVALRKAAEWFSVVLVIVAALIAFVILGSLVALPFNDLLSERADKIVTGWRDTSQHGVGRKAWHLVVTLVQESKRLSVYGILAALLLVLSFVPPLAPFTTAAQLFLAAMFFAVDYLSYPLERRGVLLARDKKAFAHSHFGASLGFGATMTLIALIPLVNFLFLPLGVVGGTLLFADLAGENQRQRPDTVPPPPPPAA
ncbi:MAG: EI24 domain-containing protein [Candidatus Sumerlaeaceae bacterium]